MNLKMTSMVLGVTGAVTLIASQFTGYNDLQVIEDTATAYQAKTVEVVNLTKDLKAENQQLQDRVQELTQELENSANTTEEVNELLEYIRVLQDRVWMLEEYINGLGEDGYKTELEKANAEVDKANDAVAQTKDNVVSILDESVFEGVLGE